MDYSSTLNLYKQLQANGAEHTDVTFSAPPVGSTVEALDEAVYGAYEGGDKQINPNDLLTETLKQVETGNLTEENRERIEENIRNSKMPAGILQEMLNNPLIYMKVGKDDVDEFAEKKLKSSAGIQAASKIIERAEKKDREKIEERRGSQTITTGTGVQVDYDKISEIVENIVSAKFAEYGQRMRLNEQRNSTVQNGVKVLQLKEDGTFLMLDTDDNIYECTLKYKGKNKKRK